MAVSGTVAPRCSGLRSRWSSGVPPGHLASRSIRFACAPLPERTVSARPPTAVVSGFLREFLRRPKPQVVLGVPPLRSAAVKATLDLGRDVVNSKARDPQGCPPTFLLVPRSRWFVHHERTGP